MSSLTVQLSTGTAAPVAGTIDATIAAVMMASRKLSGLNRRQVEGLGTVAV